MSEITLFSTSGCHLCEEAQALLEQLGVSYTLQDIIDKPQWGDQYGTKIPVITTNVDDNELGWPFDMVMLQQFLDL